MTVNATSDRAARAVLVEGLRLLGVLIRRAPAAYATAATGAVVFTSAIVASAWVIGRVTDEVIVPVLADERPVGEGLRSAAVLILGVALWKTVGIIVRRTAAGWLQFTNQARLQQELVAHQFGLTLAWYGSRATGDLLSVTDNDARQATWVLAPLPFATGVVFLLVGATALVVWTDPWLGLLALVTLAAVVAIDVRGSWLTFDAMQEAQRRRGRVGDIAHESFDGALTVKALGCEELEGDRFAAATAALRDQLVEVGRTWTAYRALTESLPAAGTLVIVLAGTYEVAAGQLTTGELVRVAYLLSLLALPVRLLGYLTWDLANSVAGWRRVREVLDVDDRVEHGAAPPRPADSGPATLEVDGVSFGYGGGQVLRDVHLAIAPGRTVAIVGPTASGKSTLAVLLARLWDPTTGAVRLDRRDLRTLRPGAVPAEVAYVGQETFLFDDTVAGNVTLGLAVAPERVREALALADADGFVDALPQGIDTPVGERGATLSGGQQQRLALARALVRRPRLLILDDATSALDPSVETRILERLARAELPATVVIVAYRRSSILLADEVVYVEGGRIVAHGTHDELLAAVPGYARLLEAYERDRLEDAPTGAGP